MCSNVAAFLSKCDDFVNLLFWQYRRQQKQCYYYLCYCQNSSGTTCVCYVWNRAHNPFVVTRNFKSSCCFLKTGLHSFAFHDYITMIYHPTTMTIITIFPYTQIIRNIRCSHKTRISAFCCVNSSQTTLIKKLILKCLSYLANKLQVCLRKDDKMIR